MSASGLPESAKVHGAVRRPPDSAFYVVARHVDRFIRLSAQAKDRVDIHGQGRR
jgi:hypothetical protein